MQNALIERISGGGAAAFQHPDTKMWGGTITE